MKYGVLAARLLIGSLFVYASIHKIFDPAEFSAAIRNYMILPPQWSNLAALTLPWIELAAGVFLILGIQTRAAALLTTGMMAVFLAAIIYAYTTGLDISCGCFSSVANSEGKIGLFHVFRDSGLFLATLAILLFDRGAFSLEGVVPLIQKNRVVAAS